MKYFSGSHEHLFAELRRLDILIRAQVERARAVQISDPQFQGLYLSEQEVDAWLDAGAGMARWAAPRP